VKRPSDEKEVRDFVNTAMQLAEKMLPPSGGVQLTLGEWEFGSNDRGPVDFKFKLKFAKEMHTFTHTVKLNLPFKEAVAACAVHFVAWWHLRTSAMEHPNELYIPPVEETDEGNQPIEL